MATTASVPFIDQVTRHLRRGLEQRLSSYRQQGRSLEEIGSAELIARRMLETIPEPSRWNERIGPFYGTSQVARLLGGVSRQAIADRRARRTLLALRTSDGVVVYPSFQFDEHNRILPGLPEVLQCFRESDVDDWTLASWLVSPSRALEGRSVVEWLRRGLDLDPVLRVAREAARRFSQ